MFRVNLFVIDKTRLLSKVQPGHHCKEASLCDLEALCSSGSSARIEKFFFRGVIYGGVQGETMCVPVLGIRAWSSLDSTVNRWEPKGS